MLAYLTSFDESERTDYLVVLAAMVGADGKITSEEILALRSLCDRFVLGPSARGKVITATTATDQVDQILARLSRTDLKHGLMLDLCLTAYWDGHLDDTEREELFDFGGKLGLTPEQVEAVLKLAEKLAQNGDHTASLENAISAGVPRDGLAMAAALEENALE